MTVLHVQTLIKEARIAQQDGARGASSVRDSFCAQLVGVLRVYDIHCADELAVLLDMPELTDKELRRRDEESQA